MLLKENIESMANNEPFETVALVKSYEERLTKKGDKYMDGMLEMKGSVPFKVWGGKLFDTLKEYEYQGCVCQVAGTVNIYNGSVGVILTSVKALEEGTYKESDFFEDKYDIPAYVEALDKLVESKCSEGAISIYHQVMGGLLDKFKVEFASRNHHDAFKGGLLAHTYKVTSILSGVTKHYRALRNFVDPDLLILGAVFHDIGKVYEYTNGVIVGSGTLVSHHTFGVEIMVGLKDLIIELKNEEFYYRLLAIIEQHHGEFEETPRTIEAYIIHSCDILESRLQSINESIEKDFFPVKIDGFKLN